MELSRHLVAVLFTLLIAILPAYGDAAAEQEGRYRRLPAGTDVSPARALEGMALALGKTNPAGFAEQITVADNPEFDKAIRLLTRRVPDHPSGFQASARTVAPVKRGEIVLAVFWARAAGASEAAEGSLLFDAEPTGEFVHYRFECEREWRRFFVPFLAAQDAATGEATVRILAGYGPQVLEVAGLRVASYGNALSFADFPFTPLAYRGRNPDAPWRAQAAAIIDKERKATLSVTVRNSKGKLVPWTDVRIRQLQHSYGFGVGVDPAAVVADSEEGDDCRWRLLDSFNQAELNSGFDWGAPNTATAATLDAAEWLDGYDLAARSQALFGADGQLPADLAPLRERRSELRTRVLDHVRERVTAAKGLIKEWTVPVALSAESELGIGLLGEVIRAARDTDPQARILLHAGNVLADGVDQAQLNAVIQATRNVLETKAPVQGIALGSHFEDQLLSPDRIDAVLDRFETLHLPLTVTDFAVDTWDETTQADYTRDFATVVFAHPATSALSLAAFWAKGHPIPNAALFTNDWTPRANARAWLELMQKRWSSTNTVPTNGKGVAKTRVFHGSYAIEVRGGGKPKVVYAKVGKSGRFLEITLPAATSN